jgi:hypothetical protein
MPFVRLLLVALLLGAVGCSSKPVGPPPPPAEPSLADQLAAAKELVEFAEEKRADALAKKRLCESLVLQRPEHASAETIAKTDPLLERTTKDV